MPVGRAKTMETDGAREERRRQAELRAAAAERRMRQQAPPSPSRAEGGADQQSKPGAARVGTWEAMNEKVLREVFTLLFGGSNVSKAIVTQWTSQGLLLGRDDSFKHILLQLQGGPCGVLAPVQAFLVKHLVFKTDFGGDLRSVTSGDITRALKAALCETLWRAGDYEGGCLVRLSSPDWVARVKAGVDLLGDTCDLDGLVPCVLGSLRIKRFSGRLDFLEALGEALEDLRTDLGVLLVLLSILTTRGNERIQGDRDDPTQPLITTPFGHASQEVVNLFLCGKAATNVFDGDMEVGGDYRLRGISSRTQVGFLTLLESHNYLTVGSFLKEPEYPVWVLGSDSHYTALFSLDRAAQEEPERVRREKGVRKVFDEFDKSGGGGFIERGDLAAVLSKARCAEGVLGDLGMQDVVTWHDLWARVSKSEFGEEEAAQAERTLQLYHVNGIAKSLGEEEAKPSLKAVTITLTKAMQALPAEDVALAIDRACASEATAGKAQWCPLVDCIRTRWKQAECHWVGDAPSMV